MDIYSLATTKTERKNQTYFNIVTLLSWKKGGKNDWSKLYFYQNVEFLRGK